MKKKEATAQWAWVNPIDQQEPATEITFDSVRAFRNGLGKFVKESKGGSMRQTVAWRAMIDLDHLARFLKDEPSTSTISSTFKFEVRAKDKKSAAKMKKMLARAKRILKKKRQ